MFTVSVQDRVFCQNDEMGETLQYEVNGKDSTMMFRLQQTIIFV